MSAYRLKSCLLLFFGFFVLAAPGHAEIGSSIKFIRVEGTQRVEEETVLAYMLVREGLAHRASAFVWDVARPPPPGALPAEGFDVILAVFTLSAPAPC